MGKAKGKGMAQLVVVDKDSAEYASVVKHMRYTPAKVDRIQRVEFDALWRKYGAYASQLGKAFEEKRVWHGSRRTDPKMIWANGFDKGKSRVGNCIWFAANSSYAMNGFQHPVADGASQLFLCYVAAGHDGDVKFTRKNKIITVHINCACYPGYLITEA